MADTSDADAERETLQKRVTEAQEWVARADADIAAADEMRAQVQRNRDMAGEQLTRAQAALSSKQP